MTKAASQQAVRGLSIPTVLLVALLPVIASAPATSGNTRKGAWSQDGTVATARDYKLVGFCGAGETGVHDVGYEGLLSDEFIKYSCSDGAILYFTIEFYGTGRGATRHMRGLARGAFVANTKKTKYGYLVRYRTGIEASCGASAEHPLRYELYWQFSNKVYSILAPTPAHILELRRANPNKYW